jgi:alanine racemase
MLFRKYFKTLNLIEIDRKRILANYDKFQIENPNCEIWPVLKSNAYGYGLELVTEILKERKPTYLIVDSYFEALKIRKINPRQKILIIGSIQMENFGRMNFRNLSLMIQDKQSLDELRRVNKNVPVHFKINTGMNRQGFDTGEIPEVEVEGIFSHIASNKTALKQLELFKKSFKYIPKYRHICATNNSKIIKDSFLNAMRLGIGLYDGALKFKATITKVRRVKKGERVSYEGTWVAKKDTWIGVISAGYYEGIDRRLSNKGFVKYKSKKYKIAGNVCMNLTVIDFGQTKPREWEQVEIILSPKLCNTIEYEVLVKLNENIRRIIV